MIKFLKHNLIVFTLLALLGQPYFAGAQREVRERENVLFFSPTVSTESPDPELDKLLIATRAQVGKLTPAEIISLLENQYVLLIETRPRRFNVLMRARYDKTGNLMKGLEGVLRPLEAKILTPSLPAVNCATAQERINATLSIFRESSLMVRRVMPNDPATSALVETAIKWLSDKISQCNFEALLLRTFKERIALFQNTLGLPAGDPLGLLDKKERQVVGALRKFAVDLTGALNADNAVFVQKQLQAIYGLFGSVAEALGFDPFELVFLQDKPKPPAPPTYTSAQIKRKLLVADFLEERIGKIAAGFKKSYTKCLDEYQKLITPEGSFDEWKKKIECEELYGKWKFFQNLLGVEYIGKFRECKLPTFADITDEMIRRNIGWPDRVKEDPAWKKLEGPFDEFGKDLKKIFENEDPEQDIKREVNKAVQKFLLGTAGL